MSLILEAWREQGYAPPGGEQLLKDYEEKLQLEQGKQDLIYALKYPPAPPPPREYTRDDVHAELYPPSYRISEADRSNLPLNTAGNGPRSPEGFWPEDLGGSNTGLQAGIGAVNLGASARQPLLATVDANRWYDQPVSLLRNGGTSVEDAKPIMLAAAGNLSGAAASPDRNAKDYRNQSDIASDNYRPPAGQPGRTRSMPELDLQGNPTGGTIQVPVPDNVLMPGENIKGNMFFGGAGMDGPYIKDMVRAFEKQGIALTPANRDRWSHGTVVDAIAGVQATRYGQLPVQPLLDNFPQGGKQFNLVGYSYGSNVAAQAAINYAQGGTVIDNLVLIGSPISEDFLKKVKNTPNIRNVIVVNLDDKGDPITAGMSNLSLIGSASTLGAQLLSGEGQGHFYYANDTPSAQVRRNALPDGHLKLLHLWPLKLLQAGRADYEAAAGCRAMREAASLSR